MNNCYHLISRGAQEQRLFESEEDCRFFWALLQKSSGRFLIRLLSCYLMPDHVHLLVHSENSDRVPRFIDDVQHKYAVYFNLKYQRRGRVWGEWRKWDRSIKTQEYKTQDVAPLFDLKWDRLRNKQIK